MAKKNNKHIMPPNGSWKHFGGSGEAAHFYHANGFPFGVYSSLFSKLNQDFNLSALGWRATWPGMGSPPKRRDWQIYADDLIAFIEQHCEAPIIGMGHSMGATCTILAAEKRPDLFKKLVLIEPAMVSHRLSKLVKLLPKAIMNLIEPAKGTLKKPDSWQSRESYLDFCRTYRPYRNFSEDAFQVMAQHGVVETDDDRFDLAFPKLWEAHNYTQPPHILPNLGRLTIPCVAIRAKPSAFFTEDYWQQWQQICPNTIFKQNLSYGHLLPLENPSVCYGLIKEGLAELS